MRIGKTKIYEAIKHIREDIKDDFWPDVLEYADYLNDPTALEGIDYGSYTPNPPVVVDIPKPTLILRPGHFIRLSDRIYYQILVGSCARKVDQKLLGRNVVFAHRINSQQQSRRMFNDGIAAWKKFNEKTEKLFNEHPGGLLLKSDISAYFEHIQIKKLCELLKHLGAKPEIAQKIESLITAWFDGGFGIPQGYDASSFLGNVYLHEVDEAMIDAGFTYYRYADDLRVFALEEKDIRRAIAKLTELMRPLNLHLSGGKTKILTKEKHLSSSNKFSDELEAISYGLEISEPVTETEEALRKIWVTIFKNDGFDKTAFSFCLNRFRRIGSEIPLKVLLAKNLLDPSFAPQVCRYLEKYVNKKSVQGAIMAVMNNSSYDWQKIFLLKTLLCAEKMKVPIGAIDSDAVYNSGNFMLIGYYFIFIAKFGSAGQRALIKSRFNNNFKDDEKIGRYFLVALTHFPNPHAEMTHLLKTKSILSSTVKYLAKTMKK